MQETCFAFIDTFCTHFFLEHPLLSLKKRHPAIWAQGVAEWNIKLSQLECCRCESQNDTWSMPSFCATKRRLIMLHHIHVMLALRLFGRLFRPTKSLQPTTRALREGQGSAFWQGWQWYSYPPPIPQTKKLHRKLTCLERNNYCLCQLFFWVPTVAGAWGFKGWIIFSATCLTLHHWRLRCS